MGLKFPTVTRCCFCVPIRIASLLIGYISILVSCVIISAISFYTFRVAKYVKENANNTNPEHPQEEVEKMALSLYISFGYYMLVFLYNFAVNLMLIIGVHRNKPQYLKLYVNTAYFLLALAITLVIITGIFMGFIATIAMLKWAFTIVFCIIVVRSTYLEMEEQNKPKTIEMQSLYTPPQRVPSSEMAAERRSYRSASIMQKRNRHGSKDPRIARARVQPPPPPSESIVQTRAPATSASFLNLYTNRNPPLEYFKS